MSLNMLEYVTVNNVPHYIFKAKPTFCVFKTKTKNPVVNTHKTALNLMLFNIAVIRSLKQFKQ